MLPFRRHHLILPQEGTAIPARTTKRSCFSGWPTTSFRLLRFLYCDPSGVIRGKQVHATRLAGTVQAGLDGLSRGLDLPEPASHDPALMPAEQAHHSGIAALPVTQAIALTELEADEVLVGGLGDLLTRCIVATAAPNTTDASRWATTPCAGQPSPSSNN